MHCPAVYREFLTYLQTIKSKSITTISEYALDLNIFFKFMKMKFSLTNESDLDKIDITDLDIEFVKQIKLTDIYEYLSYMSSERNNSAKTRSRKVACLRSYFKYMTNKAKYLSDNPAKDLESPKLKQSLPRYLSLEESKKMLSSIPRDENYARNYAIVTLFLNCGLRLSELVNININDIKEEILVVTGKGNKERSLYLNKACKNAINGYLKVRPVDNVKDKNALFLSKRLQRISNKTVQWLIKKCFESAGIDKTKYSVHKLRHTAATLMYKYGNTDLRTLQEILGHEQLSTTQIYTHVDNTSKKDALNNNPLADI